jgi:hypothetical protein
VIGAGGTIGLNWNYDIDNPMWLKMEQTASRSSTTWNLYPVVPHRQGGGLLYFINFRYYTKCDPQNRDDTTWTFYGVVCSHILGGFVNSAPPDQLPTDTQCVTLGSTTIFIDGSSPFTCNVGSSTSSRLTVIVNYLIDWSVNGAPIEEIAVAAFIRTTKSASSPFYIRSIGMTYDMRYCSA